MADANDVIIAEINAAKEITVKLLDKATAAQVFPPKPLPGSDPAEAAGVFAATIYKKVWWTAVHSVL